MTTYRVTAILSQRELIDYLDANGNVEIKIEALLDNPETRLTQTPAVTPFTPRALKRKRRTRAQILADNATAAKAAE